MAEISEPIYLALTATLYPSTVTFPFLLSPSPGTHLSTLCFQEFDYFRFYIHTAHWVLNYEGVHPQPHDLHYHTSSVAGIYLLTLHISFSL